MDEYLQPLAVDDCLARLRDAEVGRVGLIVEGRPIVIPVNYRAVGANEQFAIIIRTHSNSMLNWARDVAFEIDEFDAAQQTGWSVLVEGLLGHLGEVDIEMLGAELDARPWISSPVSWVVIRPTHVSGRLLVRPLDEPSSGADRPDPEGENLSG